VDPQADAPNLVNWSTYHYTYNNPIIHTDPNGENPIKILKTGRSIFKAGKRAVRAVRKGSSLRTAAKDFVIDVVADEVIDIASATNPALGGILRTGKDAFDIGRGKVGKKSSKFKNVTKKSRGKESVRNIETDISKKEFEGNLEKNGFDKTEINEKVTKFDKDGSSFTTRTSNDGTPTADFRKDASSKKPDSKIRLEKDQ